MKNFKPAAFYSEVKGELQKVSWPTKPQTIRTSIVVGIVVVIIMIYLGIMDGILSNIVSAVIG